MKRLPVVQERALLDVHLMRDVIASKDSHSKVMGGMSTCRKGCHLCCFQPWKISLAEGVLLLRSLQKAELWGSVKPKALEHFAAIKDITMDAWSMSEIPCPLLSEGTCLGYVGRPLACRLATSSTNPELCHPARRGPQLDLSSLVSFETKQMRAPKLREHYAISVSLLAADYLTTGDRDLDSSLIGFFNDL